VLFNLSICNGKRHKVNRGRRLVVSVLVSGTICVLTLPGPNTILV
jgi:hypothetical protein